MQLDTGFELSVGHHDAALDDRVGIEVELEGYEVLASGEYVAVPFFIGGKAETYFRDATRALWVGTRLEQNAMPQSSGRDVQWPVRVVFIEARLFVRNPHSHRHEEGTNKEEREPPHGLEVYSVQLPSAHGESADARNERLVRHHLLDRLHRYDLEQMFQLREVTRVACVQREI